MQNNPFKLELFKPTQTNIFERFCLFFVKREFERDAFTILVYKTFRGKKYIINHFLAPPIHSMCRCVLAPEFQFKDMIDNLDREISVNTISPVD